MRVYLAGPINGCTDDECSTWRNALKERLPEVSWVDPMARDYRGQGRVAYREIVEGDKADIDSADVVLVNYVKPSVGTSMEVLYAWSTGKPVIVIAASGTQLSPWLLYHATHVCCSVDAAVGLITGGVA